MTREEEFIEDIETFRDRLVTKNLEIDRLRAELAAKDARIAVLEGLVSQGISGEHAALIRAERAEAELVDVRKANTDLYAMNRDQIVRLKRAEAELLAERSTAAYKDVRIERAEAERDALRKNFAVYLITAYRAFPLETARICDEELDRSGVLLGYVRDAARAALDPSPTKRDAMQECQDEIKRLRAKRNAMREASDKLGFWLSAALEDPSVCDDMKRDINAWFVALNISPADEKSK